MSTLPERLQDVIVSFRRLAKDHEIKADRPHQDDSTRQWHMGTAEAYDDAADRLEAAQSLQAPEGWVLVPKWLLEQAYGMAREGCEAPMAAYRWCERIDSIFHGAESEYEYADFAQPLPPTFPSQSAALQAGET